MTESRTPPQASQDGPPEDEVVLDARLLPPQRRHPLIFETFDRLRPGQSLVLVNDHDPRPLFYQFSAKRPGMFAWEYMERGPEVWRVRIGRVAR